MTLSEYMSRHECTGAPQFRLLSEDDRARTFLCLTCHEFWVISRSKIRAQAREEKRFESIRKITEQEREANRRKISGQYYQGVSHGGN